MNNNINVSMVIPVKNGEKHIGFLLKAIFSQDVNFRFEVIIVDSGSKDKTFDIVKQYPIRLYQIKPYEFNHGLTRNFGISMAEGKYAALMTQDAEPYDNHWLMNLISAIDSDENIAGVYSKQIPYQDADVLTRMIAGRSFASEKVKRESEIKNPEEYKKLSPQEKHRFCNFDNVSSCIRKAVWKKIPFPETEFGEDVEWAKAVLEAGYRINYVPDSMVYHSHEFSISGWYKRNRANSSKLAALFGIHTIDNVFRLAAFFIIYAVRDVFYIFRNKNRLRGIFRKIHLVLFYSLAGVFGQYKGTMDSKCLKRR